MAMLAPTRLALLAILGVVPLLAGCSIFGDDGAYHVELRTDQTVYATADSVALTVTNHSSRPLSYVCFGHIYLQELEGRAVVNAWKVNGFEACGMRGNVIEPGDSETWTFDLGREYMQSGGIGRLDARFDASVEYRFYFELYGESVWDGDIANPPSVSALSEENRLSNRFMILARQ